MPSQGAHDLTLSRIAAARHGVVPRAVAVAAGVPEWLLDERVNARRLVPVHRGVYALGHAQLRREGTWLAAVAGYGRGATLGFVTAAAHWQLVEAPTWPVHVVVARRSGLRQRRGTRLHRLAELAADEVIDHDAIPTTTVARTILDVSGAMGGRRLEQVIRAAARRRIFDLAEVQALLRRHPHRPGVAGLRRLLATLEGVGTTDARSRLEVEFLQLCDDYDLPRPVANVLVVGQRVDFHWPRTSLIVETDGFEFHSMPTTFAADRLRDQKLTLAGYTVARLTWAQVTKERAATARTVQALLARCGSR